MPTTYLLTWNPDTSFAWEDLPEAASRVRAGEGAVGNWSFGNRTRASIGDRFFIIKQGRTLPKGIIGSGYLESEPYVGEHWGDPSRDANYVDIKFDALLDPQTDTILERELLRSPEFAQVHWDSQSSGIQINPAIVTELENLWAEILSENGLIGTARSAVPIKEAVFGELPSYPPGSQFQDRRTLSDAYVHRPPQAGIWGKGAEGAYSIVLSGGYVDDQDFGDEIIYTGQGGRDQASGRQIFDQTLTLGNLALAKSHAEGLPLRVIRGSQHRSDFSPSTGYRYDGLYRVADYWKERGEDGFDVWRYRLLRIDSYADATDGELAMPEGKAEPGRRETVSLRIVRDTKVCKAIKALYKHKCQVCGLAIDTPGGKYAEGAHIRPLGKPHKGSDTIDNVLCLCPNHHVMFDTFGFSLSDDLELIGIAGPFHVHECHAISIENVRYHRNHRFRRPHDR